MVGIDLSVHYRFVVPTDGVYTLIVSQGGGARVGNIEIKLGVKTSGSEITPEVTLALGN